jgi:hypothetical protein
MPPEVIFLKISEPLNFIVLSFFIIYSLIGLFIQA